MPMHYGSGDKDFFAVYQDILPGLVNRFDPDIILVSAGYDLHVKDPLAGLRVNKRGDKEYCERDIVLKEKHPLYFLWKAGMI